MRFLIGCETSAKSNDANFAVVNSLPEFEAAACRVVKQVTRELNGCSAIRWAERLMEEIDRCWPRRAR